MTRCGPSFISQELQTELPPPPFLFLLAALFFHPHEEFLFFFFYYDLLLSQKMLWNKCKKENPLTLTGEQLEPMAGLEGVVMTHARLSAGTGFFYLPLVRVR